MFKNYQTRKVKVGKVTIGGSDRIIIQSMCNIKTSKVGSVVKQIHELEKYGCELIRVSVVDKKDAVAIKKIKRKIHIPVIADIHFDYKLGLLAIKYGADKIRINPGNIGSKEKIKKVVDACKEKNIPIRIGINSGSLEKDLEEKYGVSAKAMIESAKRHIKILEDFDFHDIVLSLKSSDYNITVEAYRMASKLFDYPLHIGVTEPGPFIPGIINSTLALEKLIKEEIGSTIRISLTEDPVEEIKVAKQLLLSLNKINMIKLTSCPTCGRTQINLYNYVKEIEDYIYQIKANIHVAIMGCIVNGPGEAKNADLGVAGGNGKAVIFKKGEVIKTISEKDIVKELKKEINKMIGLE